MRSATYPVQVEKLLWSWPTVCRLAENEWAKGFAASIAKQARNPRWRPSPKQLQIMQRMVAEVYREKPNELLRPEDQSDDIELIE